MPRWRSSACVLLGFSILWFTAGCDGRSGELFPEYFFDANGDGASDDLPIQALQDPDHPDHVEAGNAVTLREVIVTTPMLKGTSSSTSPDAFWVGEPEGGEWSGVFVYAPYSEETVQPGDLVNLRGMVDEYYDNTELVATTVVVLSSGQPLPPPSVVTTDQAAQGGSDCERWEGVAIRLEDVSISNADLGYGDFGVKPASGTGLEMTVSPKFDTNYYFLKTVGYAFSHLDGILDYSYNVFRLQPRSCDDLWGPGDATACIPSPCPPNPVTIAQIQNAADLAHVVPECDVEVRGVVVTSPVFLTSNQPSFYVQDPAGGPWSGIFVYARGLTLPGGFGPGSLVDISGTYVEYYDNSQIEASAITVQGAAPVPDPAVMACSEINDTGALAEAYESVLVQVQGVSTTAAVYGGTDYGDFVVAPTAEPTQTLIVGWQMKYPFVCPATGGVACPTDQRALGQAFDSITGVMTWSFYHFRLEPRTDADLVLSAGP
jgi:predicted extracellular nuclease